MKIAMCQMRVVYGDADGNLARAQAYIQRAAEQGADLAQQLDQLGHLRRQRH